MTSRAIRRHHRERIKRNIQNLLNKLGRKRPAPTLRKEVGKIMPFYSGCDCWLCTDPKIKMRKLRNDAVRMEHRS